MVLEFFRGGASTTIETVESTLVEMLRDVGAVYAASTAAVFGGGKSKETKREVKSTDREINEGQREVRRALMVHAAVNESVDLPLVLTYMSVVKDVERSGDYAKNLYDLAKYGADFETAPDRDELEHYRDAVGGLIQDACLAFENRDSERATRLIDKADSFLSEYDLKVRAAYQSDGPASDAVARALYYRYLKRITAHLMNLMTSLVMPVDRLDYYDETPEDRD
jgi:phosphate uptake regulator